MKYASTDLIDGIETIVCTLPLEEVPLFDPEHPSAGTYLVPNAVAIGWKKQSDGLFAPPVPLIPTLDQLIAAYKIGIQRHLDEAAKLKGYDDIVSAASYAGYANEFQAEAISFGTWRAAVWSYCYVELDKVIAGTRPVPTLAEIIDELPVRVLP